MKTAVAGTTSRLHYIVISDRSAILVEAATSLGPVTFGAVGLEGYVEMIRRDGEPDLTTGPNGHLEVHFDRLTSGNVAYDAELRRHINARRFPTAYIDLLHASPVETTPPTYLVDGELTLSGVIVPVEGRVGVEFADRTTLVVVGQKTLDIRLFGVPAPTVFMLKVEPLFRVSMHLEAEAVSPSKEPLRPNIG